MARSHGTEIRSRSQTPFYNIQTRKSRTIVETCFPCRRSREALKSDTSRAYGTEHTVLISSCKIQRAPTRMYAFPRARVWVCVLRMRVRAYTEDACTGVGANEEHEAINARQVRPRIILHLPRFSIMIRFPLPPRRKRQSLRDDRGRAFARAIGQARESRAGEYLQWTQQILLYYSSCAYNRHCNKRTQTET